MAFLCREGVISIVVPILNEEAQLPSLLGHLGCWRQQGCEVIFVDGGSHDRSVDLATRAGFMVVSAGAGRAVQMNIGAAVATGTTLVFLHADTRLPVDALQRIRSAFDGGRCWGRFDVTIEGGASLLRCVSVLMNLRSRLTGIATGDQAIFVCRRTFERVGGFPAQQLMEDIELSRRLLAIDRPVCIRSHATTSGRRWEKHGVLRTIFMMWRLRLYYWLGAAPQRLADRYQ